MTLKELIESTEQNEIFSVNKDTSVCDTAKMMQEKKIGFLLVKDEGEVCGVVSERDIVYKTATQDFKSTEHFVSEIMSTKIIWGQQDDNIRSVLDKMKKGNFRHLPVRSENGILGIVSERDITTYFLNKIKGA
ncbi:CBS domain-containing protein [Bacteriovoracaceae bacterium]|nr:CBS domain-containing protein [Bacteriovoracaceae bacterium]